MIPRKVVPYRGPPIIEGQEHFKDCPCGRCQAIRAARPATHAMQAKHLSGASIGKLVEWEVGKSLETNEILWSPIATLSTVMHAHEEVSITMQWDDYGTEEFILEPDGWVRVTQVAA